jgi:hypothetical protein
MEIQKTQAKTLAEAELEKTKNELRVNYLQQEIDAKKELMNHEFSLNSQLKQVEASMLNSKQSVAEDRKDARVDRQAMHQKEMIDQRSSGSSLKKFESSGNDILTGGANMDRFGL